MRAILQKIQSILASGWAAPLALLLVCVAAYAPGIHRMGFYWDDWPMNWIAQNLGNPGLSQYFSTNRPVWGLLYQLTTPVLGGSPLPWQIAVLLVRFLTGVLAWALVKETWPRQGGPALASGLLFVIYPGFMQQHVALLYTHFFLVIAFWLGSLLCSVAAARRPQRFRLLTGLGLALGLANLLMMEYFFLLDLLRPLLIWVVLSEAGEVPRPSLRARLVRTLRLSAPYLAVFIGAAIWRAFLFPYTQNNYRLAFLEQLKTQPLAALLELGRKLLDQIFIVSWDSWKQVFDFIRPGGGQVMGIPGGTKGYWFLLGGLGAGLLAVLWGQGGQRLPWKAYFQRWGWGAMGVGLAALLLAGWPFWLTDVPFRLEFAYDRFTLPFMLGVSLILAGLFDLLPLWRPLKMAALAALVALGVGWQIQVGSSFIDEWQTQQEFFWQLAWRAPGLEPGTTVVVNELRIRPTDNSLTGPLNWIYAPGKPSQQLPYLLAYPTLRLESEVLPNLVKDQAVNKDYLVAQFSGSTDQVVGLYYSPRACLRLLDPQIDVLDPTFNPAKNPAFDPVARQIAALSRPELVKTTPRSQAALIPGILTTPPSLPPLEPWCETYEKAALAVQAGEWPKAAIPFGLPDGPEKQARAPAELMPFIEANAAMGNWAAALAYSQAVLAFDLDRHDMVCALWQRIDSSTPGSEEKTKTMVSLGCK